MAYDSLSTSVPGLLAVSYVARKTLSTALNVLSTSANTASYFYTYFRPGTKDKDNLRFPPSNPRKPCPYPRFLHRLEKRP